MMTQNKVKFLTAKGQLICLAASVALLSGCIWVEDKNDLVRFVSDVQARPKGKIEPLPTFKPYLSFVYEGASLRDPFVPLVRVELGDMEMEMDDGVELEPDQNRPRSYLEQFSLDDLEMVGTVGKTEAEVTWGLVRDQNGEIHRVSVGDHMGLDFGKVIAVLDERLDVLEIISDGRGGWMHRPRVVELVGQE
ncbi:pilus assembly protein PilP [Neptunomonas sp. XY-337]|uniref:pilus assembly protein PilP n=1 Tax=Neptunomonas sp. XY-337 TaxID=2561897 RepID=UPI0010AA8693|nr:pilus assembly protein PilP [Neptunomonas sp. XY-337]